MLDKIETIRRNYEAVSDNILDVRVELDNLKNTFCEMIMKVSEEAKKSERYITEVINNMNEKMEAIAGESSKLGIETQNILSKGLQLQNVMMEEGKTEIIEMIEGAKMCTQIAENNLTLRNDGMEESESKGFENIMIRVNENSKRIIEEIRNISDTLIIVKKKVNEICERNEKYAIEIENKLSGLQVKLMKAIPDLGNQLDK
jgi:hypothetical protein